MKFNCSSNSSPLNYNKPTKSNSRRLPRLTNAFKDNTYTSGTFRSYFGSCAPTLPKISSSQLVQYYPLPTYTFPHYTHYLYLFLPFALGQLSALGGKPIAVSSPSYTSKPKNELSSKLRYLLYFKIPGFSLISTRLLQLACMHYFLQHPFSHTNTLSKIPCLRS